MLQTPSVTIGIPTYNQQAYIKETILSCLEQSYPNLKVIVADDKSPDRTGEIVNEVRDTRLVYKINDKRLGRIKNYQKLLYEYSTGCNWYLNLDGDDYLTDPNFITTAVDSISSIVDDNIVFFQANHNLTAVKKAVPVYKELSSGDILIKGKDYFLHYPKIKHFTHCATLYNYEKALPLSFYSFDNLFSDFHSLSRLALTGNIILSSKKVAVWRKHEQNESKSLSEDNLHRETSSLDNISAFASQYLTAEENKKWLSQMKKYYKIIFIYDKSTYQPGWSTISFILRHWSFNWLYPRYLIKNLLLMARNLLPGYKSK